MRKLVVLPLLVLTLTGCAAVAFRGQGVPLGLLYTDTKTPTQTTQNELGKKKGEACATSILGLVTTGDASIRAAADAGGITKISAIDASFKNYLGVLATYCTVVSGQGG